MLYDVVVIGGGINGCGCAADAALRGLSVLLCEQDDLASKTSSSSSKLIHGGLRYLEQYNFRMVKQALDEQATLLTTAPHLVRPLPFVLPYTKGLRPAWLLRAGLFLYDHLSPTNPLPYSKPIKRDNYPNYFSSINADINQGFLFYDCQTDDARLTISVALQAQEHGAHIRPHTKLIAAKALDDHWLLTLQPSIGEPIQVKSKTVINAAGPWVQSVADCLNIPIEHTLSYVKGSHIVVPKLYPEDHAYILQHTDKRIVFVMPYHGYSLIGTTELVIHQIEGPQRITPEETTYLFKIIETYFSRSLGQNDIITSWSGVRLLVSNSNKNTSQLSRDYTLELTTHPLPVLTVLGGKLTAYRRLSAEVIDSLKPVFLNLKASISKQIILPGGQWLNHSLKEYEAYAISNYTWLDSDILNHYLTTYGTRTEQILSNCQSMDDMGLVFGPLLRQIEVDYLIREEWALSAEDILWRRTKLGLTITTTDKLSLEHYLNHIKRD